MSSAPKTKNDIAWEALFEKHHILSAIEETGSFAISADQIREFREPRLMAKFDHSVNLPQIFADNGLAILPVSRGDYVIGRFDAYQPFPPRTAMAVERVTLPSHLQSLDSGGITSEAVALNSALATGILEDFLEDSRLMPTVAGRMGSDRFAFQVRDRAGSGFYSLSVRGAQIEIDAALEGVSYLTLVEAKRDISDDFLIRQLYYPFRVWSERVSKPVKTVFLVYSNGLFSLYEYRFADPMSYNSLSLVKERHYTIEDTEIRMSDLRALLEHTRPVPEPELPFPQANNFRRVINLCELLLSGHLTREEITQEYAFNTRQTDYYTAAGQYLGLVGKHYLPGRKAVFSLTRKGRGLMGLNYQQRQLALCGCILEHGAFRAAFGSCLETGMFPDKAAIVAIMKRSGLYRVEKDKTFERRASTVSGWLSWMLELCGWGEHIQLSL